MARFTYIAASFCLATSSCEGDVALFTSQPSAMPALPDAGPTEPGGRVPPPTFGTVPPGGPPGVSTGAPTPMTLLPPADSGQPSDAGAGVPGTQADASPSPQLPTPIVVDGPVAELPLLGIEGGEPRRGACQEGVVIGVRTTANPSLQVFGQRLTFIEPICGKALHHPDAVGAPSGTISVTRDDSIVAWSVTDGFLGIPLTEVPDTRLTWVLQPATVCPETTPVVVGLSGEYDPVAPDVAETAAIRSLFVECAPLVVAPNGIDVAASESGHQLVSHADSFAVGGSATYRSACEDGTVTTQLKVHAGFWLDGFVLGCSSLRIE